MVKTFTIICLVTLAGCAENSGPYSDESLIGIERRPKAYPQHGYLLDNNGTYTFKASAFSRN